jgi:hypothetical protein
MNGSFSSALIAIGACAAAPPPCTTPVCPLDFFSKQDRTRGWPSTPVECYLRLMFLKFRYRLG